MENDQIGETNKQLQKNYDQMNNQLLIYQTKVNLIPYSVKVRFINEFG